MQHFFKSLCVLERKTGAFELKLYLKESKQKTLQQVETLLLR